MPHPSSHSPTPSPLLPTITTLPRAVLGYARALEHTEARSMGTRRRALRYRAEVLMNLEPGPLYTPSFDLWSPRTRATSGLMDKMELPSPLHHISYSCPEADNALEIAYRSELRRFKRLGLSHVFYCTEASLYIAKSGWCVLIHDFLPACCLHQTAPAGGGAQNHI
ncbi:hypothetical protein EVAR_22594_1 [Eumeta japonica]|uniref:Uncharacterized protein n=1 Tax=Eumeta variegata TaxID=151549 RepID=A0A4C1U7N6_EUMVA|nr:hypothetical protein EVAR_22594_1 [Eumeta japonica]